MNPDFIFFTGCKVLPTSKMSGKTQYGPDGKVIVIDATAKGQPVAGTTNGQQVPPPYNPNSPNGSNQAGQGNTNTNKSFFERNKVLLIILGIIIIVIILIIVWMFVKKKGFFAKKDPTATVGKAKQPGQPTNINEDDGPEINRLR